MRTVCVEGCTACTDGVGRSPIRGARALAGFLLPSRRVSTRGCLHCGEPVDPTRDDGFCCQGCAVARALIEDAGFTKFYELRGDRGAVAKAKDVENEPWLEALAKGLAETTTSIAHVELDVQGIRCAACVWLLEKLFRRRPGALDIEVNPASGKLSMRVEPRAFSLAAYVRDVAAVGYRVGPDEKRADAPRSRSILIRVGVCAAIAMQVMMLSLAIDLGLDRGLLFQVMRFAALGLAGIAVVVGGGPFFVGAFEAARRRTLHLDLPISLGVLFAFVGSVVAEIEHPGRSSYFDTVSIFVTLMLFGRWLQERVLEKNRRDLLADAGVGNLTCRVIEGEELRSLRVADVAVGARLLVRVGELVPLDGTLESGETAVRRDWLTGEPHPHRVKEGEAIEGGSFVAGTSAAIVVVTHALRDSRLATLLRPPSRDRATDLARRTELWARVARAYVVGTLTVASLSAGAWMFIEPARALDALVAILVVACPCAFGIAVPIAYEIVQARLRSRGVFVRSASLLDRLPRVRKLVFDKTGTLTLGTMEIVDDAPLRQLSAGDRSTLYDLVARSNHPKSVAVERWLAANGARLSPNARVDEVPGKGMVSTASGHLHRFGAPSWASRNETEGDVVFSRDGHVLAALRTRETLAEDAIPSLERLREEGFELHLLSGDEDARAFEAARRLGVEARKTRAHASPEDKRRYITRLDAEDTLMVGDGVNDAAAMDAAFACLTPSGDLLPARTDAFVTGRLATGVARILAEAQRLDRVVHSTVLAGATYNVVAVAVAATGHMSPLLAAVLMPASSIAVVLFAVLRLRGDAPSAHAPRASAPPVVSPSGVAPWKSSSSSSS